MQFLAKKLTKLNVINRKSALFPKSFQSFSEKTSIQSRFLSAVTKPRFAPMQKSGTHRNIVSFVRTFILGLIRTPFADQYIFDLYIELCCLPFLGIHVVIVIRYTYRTYLSVTLSIKLSSFLQVPNITLDQMRYLCLHIYL